MCYIKSPRAQDGDFLFDPCANTPPVVISDSTLTEESIFQSADAFGPATMPALLMRVIRNLLTALGTNVGRDTLSEAMWSRITYAASAAFATIGAFGEVHVLPEWGEDCVLDGQGVVVEALLPHVHAHQQPAFVRHLDDYIRRVTKYKVRAPKRRTEAMPAEVFVGQVVFARDDSLAMLLHWEPQVCAFRSLERLFTELRE